MTKKYIYIYSTDFGIFFSSSFTTNPFNDDYFMDIYIKSHTRAGPYIVGAIFGYLLFRRKKSTTKLNMVRYYHVNIVYIRFTVER